MNFLNQAANFFKDIYNNRKIIKSLAINDFKARFTGSYLGIVWAFVQPLISILVFWFVFQVGFKNPPVQNFPFILWLIPGMIPWNFFAEAFNTATNSLFEYKYLVKNVVFRTSILPLVKIISALFVHLFFMAFIFFMYFVYGEGFSIYNMQIIYYSFCIIVLLIGLCWITSSINIFFKDTSQVINVIIQIGFWLTPIFWSQSTMPEKYLKILRFNPMFYIVQGYRDTFINHIWFWQRLDYTVYFWVLSLLLCITGASLFRKLRPHFSDIL